MVREYAIFAARYGIEPRDAYVLPALFENAAGKAKMPLRAFVAEATYRNRALGDYLAGVCRKIAAEDGAA